MSYIKGRVVKSSAPTSSDDSSKGYYVGFKWVDSSGLITSYECYDDSVSAADWRPINTATALEEFYFQRVETIDNNSGTPLEYFTEVQGGTEITNTATFTGGTYSVDINFACLNTSTSGSVKVDPQVGGVSVFAEPYEVEPKDNDNIYYVGVRKRITIAAGVRAVDLNLTNVGSGTGRIFEANVTLTKI